MKTPERHWTIYPFIQNVQKVFHICLFCVVVRTSSRSRSPGEAIIWWQLCPKYIAQTFPHGPHLLYIYILHLHLEWWVEISLWNNWYHITDEKGPNFYCSIWPDEIMIIKFTQIQFLLVNKTFVSEHFVSKGGKTFDNHYFCSLNNMWHPNIFPILKSFLWVYLKHRVFPRGWESKL